MPDVVIVGGYTVDFSCYTSRFPKAGETVLGDKFITSYGGKGANQCVSVARLGGSTGFVASFGTDSFGEDYLKQLKLENVDVSKVYFRKGIQSNMAQITVADTGENTIILVPGANIRSEEVLDAGDLIKEAKVLICQFEIPTPPTLQALKIFKGHGLSILNGAPAVPNPDSELLKLCDVFCVNETEAEQMTGVSVSEVSEAQEAVNELLSQGCNAVILTLGPLGAVYASQSNRNIIHVPTEQVTAIDTTGAGDAFVGSFAYFAAYHANLPIEEKLRRACYIASQTVTRIGTQSNFPYKDELPSDLFSF